MSEIKRTISWYKKMGVLLTFILALLCGTFFVSYAQSMTTSKAVDQMEGITKFLGILGVAGGAFIGYLQVRIGIKVAELEIKLTHMMNTIRLEMINLVKDEVICLDKKITETTKEIKSDMVTSKEVASLRREEELRHEIVKTELKGITDMLKKT